MSRTKLNRMARKTPGPIYPLMLDGAVQADVLIAHLPPSISGARPTPFIKYRFINEQGQNILVSSTLRGAADALRRLTMVHQHIAPDVKGTRGRERAPEPPTFEARPESELAELDGFRFLHANIASTDRHGRISPGLFITGRTTESVSAEFPLIWIHLTATEFRTKKYEVSFLMDLWAASALRDRLYSALTTTLPSAGPTARDVQVVDGIIGTYNV